MTIIDVTAITTGDDDRLERYDYSRLPEEIRIQAMTAEGTIVQGLRSAVQRVIEAGQVLLWAKEALPHGEYLPWVHQACGLKPRRAAELVKAAEWVQMSGHAAHLENAADPGVLFLLSADATPDDVRQWALERCAAGTPPTRAEVAERKRQASGKPPALRPIELQALALWRKDQLSDVEAALALARSITTVTEAQVLEEIGLRELPRGKVLNGCAADFHRRPDGISWDRIPHAGRVDVAPGAAVLAKDAEESKQPMGFDILSTVNAADLLGMKPGSLSCQMNPKVNPSGLVRQGYRVTRHSRGLYKVQQINDQTLLSSSPPTP